MLNKVKGLFNKDEKCGKGGDPKIWKIPPTMRGELEKGGVKYNIKVVIRGMRRTGKSSLLARLHGHSTSSTYLPSQEISAATIRFQNEVDNVDEGAKVEIWDVVDEGIAPTKSAAEAPTGVPQLVADARNIDVYRNCHAALFVIDVSRRETLDYVEREAQKVPPTCAICIVINFIDLPKPHAVSERDVSAVASKLGRCTSPLVHFASQGLTPHPTLSIAPTWVSVCAATGQGVSMVKSLLTIPLFLVKLETIETQMKDVYKSVELFQASLFEKKAMLAFEEKEKHSQFTPEQSLGTVNIPSKITFSSKDYDGTQHSSETKIQEDFWDNSDSDEEISRVSKENDSLSKEYQTAVDHVETKGQHDEISVPNTKEDHSKLKSVVDSPNNSNIDFVTGDTYNAGVSDAFFADVGDDYPSPTYSDNVGVVVETISKESRSKSTNIPQVHGSSEVKVDIDALMQQMQQIWKPEIVNEHSTKEKKNKKPARKEKKRKETAENDDGFDVIE